MIEKEPITDAKTVNLNLIQSIKAFLKSVFDVRSEVDFEAASENIKNEVSFRGFNIWILMLSILICSIGLNLNSTAVVIGAMLISPLMGPITGLGFAVGTFDKHLLISSLKNIAIALVISILVSFLFFKFAPSGLNQSELLSRTKPGVLDLLVATFGGFAGILAASKNVKTNVVPGVAIATALMPPLCTAGFGLATGSMTYFLGALYLFFINSIFISLSALLVIRYFRFPIKSYVDLATRKRGRLFIIVFVIAVSIPSILIYRGALKQSLFEFRAKSFVETVINSDERQADHINLFYTDSIKEISVWVFGKEISQIEEDSLQNVMRNFGLNKAALSIRNMGDFESYKKMMVHKESEISLKSTDNDRLRNELVSLQSNHIKQQQNIYIPEKFRIHETLLNQEAKLIFEPLDSIQCLWSVGYRDSTLITIPTFVVLWQKPSSYKNRLPTTKVSNWLHVRFEQKFDSMRVLQVYQ